MGNSNEKASRSPVSNDEETEAPDDCSDCFCKCCTIFGRWTGVQCCCCNSKRGEVFLSIKEERYCTDVPCCIFFILVLIASLTLTIWAALNPNSEPNRLIYWTDYNGDFCAPYDILSNNVSIAGNYAVWPDLRMLQIRTCIDSCAESLNNSLMVTPPFDANIIDVPIDIATGNAEDISGYSTNLFLETICLPDPGNFSSIVSAKLYKDATTWSKGGYGATEVANIMISDFVNIWSLYIICACTAFFLSIIWGIAVMKMGRIIIWISIIFMVAGVLMVGVSLITLSQQAQLFGYEAVGDVMWWIGFILIVLDIMLMFALCFMYTRILLSIELVKETYRALLTVPTMIFYPIIPIIFFCGFFGYWLFGAVYLTSITVANEIPYPAGVEVAYYKDGPTLAKRLNLDMDNDPTFVDLAFDSELQDLLYFHFFVLLWLIWFIGYHSYMVIGGVYAEWYFADWTDGDETKKIRSGDPKYDENAVKLSSHPVWDSFYRVTRYHLGSVAFASLTIAIVHFIEITLTYLERRFTAAKESPLKKHGLAVVKCMLRCMKCILNRINKDGLIITSIYGWPFCAASTKGISIVFKNILRSAVLSFVSGYFEFLGKASIIFFNVAICVFIAEGTVYNVQIVILPCIVFIVISYMVTWVYLEIYEVGVRTIFICFLIDEERNKELEQMKCSKRLRKIIGARKVPKYYLAETATSELNADFIPLEERNRYNVYHPHHDEGLSYDVEMTQAASAPTEEDLGMMSKIKQKMTNQ